jgi:hypothetical protein
VKKNFALLSFGLSVCLFSTSITEVSANQKNEGALSLNVKSSANSINFSWGNIGDNYKLVEYNGTDQGKLIWSGKQHSVSINHLESNHAYEYKFIIYDKNNKIDEAIVHTSTLKSEKQVQEDLGYNNKLMNRSNKNRDNKLFYPMVNSQINSIVENNKITLSWLNVPDDDGIYDVYKNGKLVKNVKGLRFVDSDVLKGKIYQYKIVGSKKLPTTEILYKKNALKKAEIKITKENEKYLFYETKEIGTIVNTSTNTIPSIEKDKNTKIFRSRKEDFQPPNGLGYLLRYTTFIPMDKAPNPVCNNPLAPADPTGVACKYDSFHGDGANRGFDPWSESFRTRSDAYVTWDYNTGKPNKVAHNPQTGVTIGYKDGKEIARDEAPYTDMKIASEETGSDWIYHRMFLASNIPLIPIAPDIDAFYYAKVYKDGKSEFYGVHDRAPSHEFYMMFYPGDGDMVVPIIQHPHVDFNELWPVGTKTEWKLNIPLSEKPNSNCKYTAKISKTRLDPNKSISSSNVCFYGYKMHSSISALNSGNKSEEVVVYLERLNNNKWIQVSHIGVKKNGTVSDIEWKQEYNNQPLNRSATYRITIMNKAQHDAFVEGDITVN